MAPRVCCPNATRGCNGAPRGRQRQRPPRLAVSASLESDVIPGVPTVCDRAPGSGLRGVRPMPIERRRKPRAARMAQRGFLRASEGRMPERASARWRGPRPEPAGPVGRIGSPAGDMLETFGLCEDSPDRSCQLRATQSSSVSARAPSRLLSIARLGSRAFGEMAAPSLQYRRRAGAGRGATGLQVQESGLSRPRSVDPWPPRVP